MAELSHPTFELYDELERAGLAADMTSRGLLHVFSRPRVAARSLASAAVMRRYGYTVPDDLLTGTELRELEPTLSRRAETGYLIGKERHIDPALLTAGLAGLARKAGAEIWEQTEARRLDHAGRRVRAVVTGDGSLPVASVILAGGASCGMLLRPLGIRLPLTAGKGYSFLRRLRTLPGRPIHFGDIKVAVTPFARNPGAGPARSGPRGYLPGNSDKYARPAPADSCSPTSRHTRVRRGAGIPADFRTPIVACQGDGTGFVMAGVLLNGFWRCR